MDDFIRKRSNILFIQGIFLRDLKDIDNVFDEKFIEQSNVTIDDNLIVYQENPKVFTTLAEWPIKTNLWCWTCSLVPDGRPIFIPEDIFYEDGIRKMHTLGNFCTFNCATDYIDVHFRHDPSWDDKKKFLKLLYYIFTGRRCEIIKPSPRKTKMQQYCGELEGITTVEYRDLIDELNSDYELSKYKIENFRE